MLVLLIEVISRLSVPLVVDGEYLALHLEELLHLIIFKLKIVTDHVPCRLLKFLIDLSVVNLVELLDNSPEHLGDELVRGHQRFRDQLQVIVLLGVHNV